MPSFFFCKIQVHVSSSQLSAQIYLNLAIDGKVLLDNLLPTATRISYWFRLLVLLSFKQSPFWTAAAGLNWRLVFPVYTCTYIHHNLRGGFGWWRPKHTSYYSIKHVGNGGSWVWWPKTAIFSDFGCKKMGLRMPKSKNGDHFLSPTIPKNSGIDFCFTSISFSGEFWANFENRVF